jgi:hypothetical protein
MELEAASAGSSKTIAKPTFSPEEKLQLLARYPRYKPQSPPSNEALGRNLGNKGKRDATSSEGTGKNGVRQRFCKSY